MGYRRRFRGTEQEAKEIREECSQSYSLFCRLVAEINQPGESNHFLEDYVVANNLQ